MGLLAHFRNPADVGPAAPGWGQSQRWGLEGQTPSVSIYQAEDDQSDTDWHRDVRGGEISDRGRIPVEELTMTRRGRIGAQLVSLPAARFFQSYTGSGTGRAEVAGVAAWTPRSLTINFNPNAQGAAELHPATSYQPYPSPSELYPKVV